MISVFQKFLNREFGKNKYEHYVKCYRREILNRKQGEDKINNQEVYLDIYEGLKHSDLDFLESKMEKLLETMYLAAKINRQYVTAFLVYLGASLFLITLGLNPMVTVISLILMSVSFIYKTCEFVVNKYCYIDARIILVYKAVLDALIRACKN